MTAGKFICGIFFLLIINSCRDKHPNEMSRFTGMWKLDKYESFDSTAGKWQDAANRTGYSGYLLYDGLGHVGVQLIPPGFKDLDNSKNLDSLNEEELRKIVGFHFRSFEYFGNYKITSAGNSIEHYKLSSNNPKEYGTTVIRDFEFRGDTLILTAKELVGGLKARLRWVKL